MLGLPVPWSYYPTLPQTPDYRQYRLPLGIYKGKTLGELLELKDRQGQPEGLEYLTWLSRWPACEVPADLREKSLAVLSAGRRPAA